MRRERSPFRLVVLLVGVAALFLAAGCGDDENDVESIGAADVGTTTEDEADAGSPSADSTNTGEGEYRDGAEDEEIAPDAEGGGEVPAPRPTDEGEKPAPATGGERAQLSSGIEGTVLLRGRCPVEQGDDGCPSSPTSATVTARPVGDARDADAASSQPVASASAGADGTFSLAVEPGRFEVEASVEGAQCTPVVVDVPPSGSTHVDLYCDSAMR